MKQKKKIEQASEMALNILLAANASDDEKLQPKINLQIILDGKELQKAWGLTEEKYEQWCRELGIKEEKL